MCNRLNLSTSELLGTLIGLPDSAYPRLQSSAQNEDSECASRNCRTIYRAAEFPNCWRVFLELISICAVNYIRVVFELRNLVQNVRIPGRWNVQKCI